MCNYIYIVYTSYSYFYTFFFNFVLPLRIFLWASLLGNISLGYCYKLVIIYCIINISWSQYLMMYYKYKSRRNPWVLKILQLHLPIYVYIYARSAIDECLNNNKHCFRIDTIVGYRRLLVVGVVKTSRACGSRKHLTARSFGRCMRFTFTVTASQTFSFGHDLCVYCLLHDNDSACYLGPVLYHRVI